MDFFFLKKKDIIIFDLLIHMNGLVESQQLFSIRHFAQSSDRLNFLKIDFFLAFEPQPFPVPNPIAVYRSCNSALATRIFDVR